MMPKVESLTLNRRKTMAVIVLSAALLLLVVAAASALNIGTFDQCSNDLGSGYTSGDTGCRWINGNLQKNNSTYIEGDATVQRLWLTDLTAGQHTITLHYGSTKGGTHAYDYLTTWSWSEGWITLPDRCEGIPGCTAWPVDTLPIPHDPYMNSLGVTEPAGQVFTMYNGDLLSATTPVIAHGAYSGDSDTEITITFNVDPNTAQNCATSGGTTTCSVMLIFGAHVARTIDWETQGGGAGLINGSPYHVALELVDGASAGQRDNQMQNDTVVANGTLIIVKDAIPNDAQDFAFTVTGNSVNHAFDLDDDADPTLSNTHTLPLPPGIYSASEIVPSGWSQQSATCDNGSSVGAIALASGATVTCTFTNIQNTVTSVSIASFSATGRSGQGPFGLPLLGVGVVSLAMVLVVRRPRR